MGLTEAGDKVPADIRLYSGKNLKIDEAILTGESNAAKKQAKEEVPENTPLAERSNMAFSGTLVASGIGEGVVVATGIQTEIGKINQLLIEVKTIKTPLLRKCLV